MACNNVVLPFAGIGRAVAVRLSHAGAQVVAVSRTQADLESLQKEVEAAWLPPAQPVPSCGSPLASAWLGPWFWFFSSLKEILSSWRVMPGWLPVAQRKDGFASETAI